MHEAYLLQSMLELTLSFVTAFTLTYFAIPHIIAIARKKRLYDEPNERSSHVVKTPSLGGIGIFAGAIFALVLWTPDQKFGNLQYILCAFIILFLIGAKDDIQPVSARNKLIAQVLAASILVFKSDIKIESMYGLFGLDLSFPPTLSVIISIMAILLIINSFNLIDGINGLAGGVSVLIFLTLGTWFHLINEDVLAILSFSFSGAVIAFLRYNFTPAKIFMGDTGSLLIGIVCSILIIKFIRMNDELYLNHPYKFHASPAVAIGIIIIPLFDTLRVFTTRIYRGISPFKPDKRHIHHLLIDFGLNHIEATYTLLFVNIFFITIVLSLHNKMELHLLLSIVIGIAIGSTWLLHRSVKRKKQKLNHANT